MSSKHIENKNDCAESGRHKISVILPVRDGDRQLLMRAVDSALCQRGVDFEILLADDGSKEAEQKYLDGLAERDSRIRVIHMDPAGVSAARNRAMREADGDILTFLDCDDALAPGCFAEAVQILDEQSVDAVWGGTRFADAAEMDVLLKEQKDSPDLSEQGKADVVMLGAERLHCSRAECIGEPYRFGGDGYINRGIAARFIRKKALEEKNLYFPEGLRMYEDTIWNLEMMQSLRVCYAARVWYYYFDNQASASNRFYEEGADRIEIPLVRIGKMLDLENDIEYAAYTRFLMDSLRYVYNGVYGNPVWRPEPGEKKKLRQHLYRDMPWAEIGSRRFRASAEKRDRQKAVLYSRKLLLAYWGMIRRGR